MFEQILTHRQGLENGQQTIICPPLRRYRPFFTFHIHHFEIMQRLVMERRHEINLSTGQYHIRLNICELVLDKKEIIIKIYLIFVYFDGKYVADPFMGSSLSIACETFLLDDENILN